MLRVHSYESMGTFDGPGLRLVVFLQGCNFRCLYCANPDTIEAGAGTLTDPAEILRMAVDQKPFFGRRGGVTFSGGEPTFQAAELVPLVKSLKEAGIHVCIDSNGGEWNPAVEELLGLVDLVLLDIKHADPVEHKKLTGCDPARILAFGDELARRKIKVVIRHVVVPGITDTVEECEALGRLIAPWHNVVGLEMLPYHTMGVVKYEQLGIPYKLEGVPQMDTARMPELRNAVMTGMKKRRAELKNAIG